jgi:hypothetical protein
MSLDYMFTLDLAKLTPEQLQVLGDLGPTISFTARQLDDERYTRVLWFLKYKEALDLEHPATFSEKIQWLKLRARDPRLPGLIDKLAVRSFVADRIGDDILNPLLYVGDDLDAADLASLPDRFFIKCTHGSTWNIAVPDKRAADWPTITQRIRYWLSINYYDLWREWAYADIPPRVIVEPLLEDPSPLGLLDYKVLCCNGRARYVQVDFDRAGDHTRNIYDTAWNRIPCAIHYPMADFDVSPPRNLATMLELAEALADGFTFMRVDLFNIDGRIVFGELTFFPGNGLIEFTPFEYDRVFGDQLELPRVTENAA